MAKKPSGLGRGLDELLEDNTPSRRTGGTTLVHVQNQKKEEEPKKETPVNKTLYTSKNTSLYNTTQPTLKAILKSNKRGNK